MPLNIRPKPAQSKLSAGTKNNAHAAISSPHPRFAKSPKANRKQGTTSTPGCRSGLEPGSVLGGVHATVVSSKPPTDPRLVLKTTSKSKPAEKPPARGPVAGKTLSMENIQSLSAAYATSGTMYPNERDSLEPSGGYPKGTMTLGRTTSRSSYRMRSNMMGSSPNIHHSSEPHVDQPSGSVGLWRQSSGRLDRAGRGEESGCDLQNQLRELQRENDTLRKELDGGRDGKTGPHTNRVEFWCPEVKREKGTRQEIGARTVFLKEQYRPNHDDEQQYEDIRRDKQYEDVRRDKYEDIRREKLPLTVQELQEELRAHREMNNRPQLQPQGNSSSCRELHMDQNHRAGPQLSPGHTPNHLHSPAPKNSPRASPSNTYNPRQQDTDIIIHSPGYACSTSLSAQRISPANTLLPGTRSTTSRTLYSPNQAPTAPPNCAPCCQVPGCDGFCSPPPLDPTDENFSRLQSEHERQAKELNLLRKTMEEMELRIDSQKQTLGARDESIQRLLEMLQGQGQHWGQRGPRAGTSTSTTSAAAAAAAAQEAESQLENMHVRENTNPTFYFDPDVIWQDTKISSLERNIRDLEDEVQMLKTSGVLHPDERQDELKQLDVYKSHSRFMKSKIEQMKLELNKKESEMQGLQTKLETLTNQNSDCKQHIEVLKESLNAKEQRSSTLQTEVDALRVRLEEKEQFLTKKTKQLQDLSDEKSTLTGELRDMKDMLEVKERKVIVLQKKIENLLEQLKDKDKQLLGLRERVQGLQTDSSNTDTALATLEEALSEKERVIENLREQREREERLRLEEMERLRKENQELKDKLCTLQPQNLSMGQTNNHSLSPNPRPDVEVPKVDRIPAACPTTPGLDDSVMKCPDITDRLRVLEQEVSRYREESRKSQAEVERLMGALRDAETDKTSKERTISDLERQIKSPNLQKQMVPADMRKDVTADGHPHSLSQLPPPPSPSSASQDAMRETAERITDLETALRESMNTSAHREALWAQEEGARVQAQRELEDLMGALEKTRQELDATKLRLTSTQQSLRDRDGHLSSLRQERRKQMEEILEMKQQALLAAISEKDANIALLELSASKRKQAQEEVMALKREKDRLMHQLKQQTQSRMNLISDSYADDHQMIQQPQIHPHHTHHMLHPPNAHHRNLPRSPAHSNHQPSVEQDDEEGIWA